jgi:cytochrome b6-f complex iron-sulfur subunit
MDDAPASAEGPGCDGEGCTRRRLLNVALTSGAVATGGAVLYPLGRFLLPPEIAEASVASVVAGRVEDFPLNSGKIFKMGTKAGLLVRLPDGQFRAFNAVCTHLSCRVQYRADNKSIWCACHNGFYDLTGKNVSGPPPRPLETFVVNVRSPVERDGLLVSGEIVVSRGTA